MSDKNIREVSHQFKLYDKSNEEIFIELRKIYNKITDLSQDLDLYRWDMQKHINNPDCMEYQSAEMYLKSSLREIKELEYQKKVLESSLR